MKKSMTALASLMLVGLMSVPALAANCSVTDSDGPMVISPAPTTGYQQTIQIDGQKTNINSRVMVPLRALGEKLGFTVTWKDGEAKLENKDIYTVVRPGETLFLYTDGVNEAMNAEGDVYSNEAMFRALASSPSQEPASVLRHMLDDVSVHVNGNTASDDMTILCVRYFGGKR